MNGIHINNQHVDHAQGKEYAPNGDLCNSVVDDRIPLSARSNAEAYGLADASGDCSPIPRISEPASPALPQKFHQRHRILFPMRRHYIPGKNSSAPFQPFISKRLIAENEFWREDVEAQGLQVLSWGVDDVCQLLIHIGLGWCIKHTLHTVLKWVLLRSIYTRVHSKFCEWAKISRARWEQIEGS